jgi:small-conductance mechanosensitive channel
LFRCSLLGLTILFTAASHAALAQHAETESDAEIVHRAPVAIDGQTLFRVRGISAYPAERRAQTIAGRIEALASNPAYRPGSLRVAELPALTRIEYQGQVIVNITEADARVEGVARPLIAALLLTRIDEAVLNYRQARTSDAIWRSILWSLAWTVAFLAALALFLLLYRRLESAVEAICRRHVQKDHIRAVGVLQADQFVASILHMLRWLRAVLLLVAFLGWLNLLLSQFPWTRNFSNQTFDLVLVPLHTMWNGVASSLPDLAFVAVLAVILRWVLRLIRTVFEAIGRGTLTINNFEPEWAEPTFRISRLLVIAFGVVVAYPYLPGSGSEAFKGVSLFIGVIFSLGSTGFISNMVAGYSLTYRRAYRVGDRVKIGDVVGDVEQIRIQVTHLRSLKNEEVIIPNSVIVNSNVTNFSSMARKTGLILHTTVGIGYETPWRQVEAMLKLAASRTEGLLREPPPFVQQKSLGDFCVVYELNVYCDQPARQMALYSELHRNILDVFNEYGVQIMTPAYEGDPTEPKLVPRDKWFESPAANGDPVA